MTDTSHKIAARLVHHKVSPALFDILPDCSKCLPQGVSFDDDIWNLLEWKPRKGNSREYNVDFSGFNNKWLKDIVKVFLLHLRLTKHVGAFAAYNYVRAIKFLDKTIWLRNESRLVNGDFYRTEEEIVRFSDSPHRTCEYLSKFGEWLTLRLGIAISYKPTFGEVHKHGRKGPEEGRKKKLIDTLVIRDMVEANAREGLSDKDRFFLSAFVILSATGFRINELATLRKDCLECRDGNYTIRYFAEKVRKLEARFISQDMVLAVQAALGHIITITEPGREAVRKLRESPGLDWFTILQDDVAAEYFVGQFAHDWTAHPRNRMINPDGVWLEKEQRTVDILSVVRETGSKSKAAQQLGVSRATVDGLVVAQQNARKGMLPCTIASRGKATRTDWDTDTRVISSPRFIDHCGIVHKWGKRGAFSHIIDEAQRLQLQGQAYPAPAPQPVLERKYVRKIRPVVEDKSGRALLQPEDALFIIPRYLFSKARSTKEEDYRLISDKVISRWFSGETRARGTGNHEDSCFARLGIIDPDTGGIAKLTSHDVRHWLDTIYAEGHMDEDAIALIFSRKKGANHTYDQTSKKTRMENIRQAVRDGKALGHISENYHRLAEFSRESAEQYLLAGTRMVNIMPHGACTLSWGMEVCPNHLSCFAGEKGCCEHLHIDITDEIQVEEVKRIEREVAVTLDFMPEKSPQYRHFESIKQNIDALFSQG